MLTFWEFSDWLMNRANSASFLLHITSSGLSFFYLHVQSSLDQGRLWQECCRKVLSFLCVWRDAPGLESFIFVMSSQSLPNVPWVRLFDLMRPGIWAALDCAGLSRAPESMLSLQSDFSVSECDKGEVFTS